MSELSSGLAQARPYISIGMLVVLLAWESLSGFFHFMKSRERLKHGFLNVLMGGINALVTGVAFVGLWWWVARWAESQQFGLLHWVPLPTPLRFLVAFLAFDLWMYLWHRLNHRVPFFWRFHRVHHSDPTMDVTTSNRFHFGEIILSSLLRIPVIALLGLQMHEIAIYEVMMFTIVQFHHANIALPEKVDRFLRLFIVTPFMHKVHHSRWQPETDSNYASFLSIWDRLFRSFRLNSDPASIRFGLEDFNAPAHQSIGGMMGTPWSLIASDGKAVSGGIRRGLMILIPALALVAGAWFLAQSLKPESERIAELKREIAEEFPEVRHLPTADLDAWLADGGRRAPWILDVRDADDYSESHIPHAILVSPDASADELLPLIDPEQPVVVYCYMGRRSSIIARRLNAAGVKRVMNLEGSFTAWESEGRPVVSCAQAVPAAPNR